MHINQQTADPARAPSGRAAGAWKASPRPGVSLARALGNHDFGRWIQPKLAVGAVDDPLERVADAVVGTAAAAREMGDGAISPPYIQRRASSDGGTAGSGAIPVPPGFASRMAGLGGGAPLAPGVRAFFEPRLGTDLAGVRVHAGAAASAAAVEALIYRTGRWRPRSSGGSGGASWNPTCPPSATPRASGRSRRCWSTQSARDRAPSSRPALPWGASDVRGMDRSAMSFLAFDLGAARTPAPQALYPETR